MVNFATIAVRELRTHARQGATYRQRTASGLVAAAIVTVMLVIGTLFSSMRTMGPTMFQTLAWLGFVFCLVEGLRGTVDSLSSEKREGTLGLLFLTELSGFDVVAGKFVVHSTASFYRLVAALPALAIPFVIGGVTSGEFWRMMLALLNTLFFSLSLGLLISACGRSERGVWGAGLSLLGVFAVILPLADQVLGGGDPQKTFALFGLFGPRQAFHDSAAASYLANPTGFWMALGAAHLTAWGFLFASGWLLARNWNRFHDPTSPSRWETLFAQKAPRPSLAHQAMGDPLQWLARLEGQRFQWLLLVLAGLFGLCLLLWFYKHTGTADEWWAVVIIFWALHWGLRIWAAVQACSAMGALKESGMMELLLATPVADARIIRSLITGLRRNFLPPFVVLATIEISACLLMAIYLKSTPGLLMGFLAWAICLGILFEDLQAVTNAGLWYTLILPKTTSALTRTITRVLLLPLLVMVVVLFPFAGLCCGLAIPVIFIVKGATIANNMHVRLEKLLRLAASQSLLAPPQDSGWWPFGAQRNLAAPPMIKMAGILPTVQCSICGQWVDSNAKECPFCHWPFTAPAKPGKKSKSEG